MERFAELLEPHVHVERAEMLNEAVTRAMARARPGEVILLSPACASFDMFRDYPHRAQVFCQTVVEIAEAAGQVMESSL